MNEPPVYATIAAARRAGRIAIVGASLAGLTAAKCLREAGFSGPLTMIGDEPYAPYDRPPLSKAVLLGVMPPENAELPGDRNIDAEWRLGARASALDLTNNRVVIEGGDAVDFDQVLIATGVRARTWPNAAEAGLDGVFVVRTRDDARRLNDRISARPNKILVIGGGFTGSEIASVCRELGLEVTLTERGPAPLIGALGGMMGAVAADLQREHGVDLRTGVTVTSLEGDGNGRLVRAHLSDDTTLDVDVAVVAMGAIRNTEWLAGSGLAAGPKGVACDTGCRAFDLNGIVTDNVFVAGDIARAPHPLYEYQMIALEHWGNAVAQAEVAAHNMVNAGPRRRPHLTVPAFWSSQFGVNIKSVGIPTYADHITITQGSLEKRRFVATYGYRGRVTAAVAFNQGKWMDFYRELIESAAPFPPEFDSIDPPESDAVHPADLPDPAMLSHGPTVALTGYLPTERRMSFVAPRN
ncbi:NAD(P)/FAD-dependent oxidoreductase [Antrihabitans sp. YC2-6]|uniref:NAD(P)/FAD-dependent oxidoreductase n=1 Tax=Antrihabitans sp. YC2-6 TaxID=2799498 RepID=UPI0018F6C433|nr:FAD-dependent oxidoreductase [Antrihabitans sp. YC2-6]MBJ8345192.1 FAD-dependent oxidoreductase [Antrihabitans sp. YC2-6]